MYNSVGLHPFERIEPGESSYGFVWGPTDDPNEINKRWRWDHIIYPFSDMTEKFTQSRKGRGKEYFGIITWYFMDEMYEMNIEIDDAYWESARDDKGWIKSSKIEHDLMGAIPHRTTLFRLLADMVKAEILQKKVVVEKTSRSSDKKQKPSVYYRLLLHEPWISHLHVMTHDELLRAAIKYYKGFNKYGELYLGAREYLKLDGFHKDDIDDILMESLEYLKEDGEDCYRANIAEDLERLLQSV